LLGAALSALFVFGCAGAASTTSDALELGQARQPIIGGELDRDTSGVVGLALDLGAKGAAGHCSGTLIAPNLVLTARHCVAFTDESSDGGVVQCDSAHFNDPLPAHTLLVSPAAVRPTDANDPSYVRGKEIRTLSDSDVCGYDMALIILEDNIGDSIQTIEPRLAQPPAERETFSTVGYGLTKVGDPSSDGTRQRADGSIVRCSREDCVALSDGSIRDSEWASVDAPICSGDSGGPALDDQGRVFGVASRGDVGCEIAVYGDVSMWAPFIQDTGLDAANLGGYTAPAWTTTDVEPSAATTPQLAPESSVLRDGGCSLQPAASGRNPGALLLAALLVPCLGWLRRRRLEQMKAP
jgi:hypothetical protein